MYAIERFVEVAKDTDAALLYSDHYSIENAKVVKHPVIDYQEGSIRDDFDFGSIVVINSKALHEYAMQAVRTTFTSIPITTGPSTASG